jgi:hypothetical protein
VRRKGKKSLFFCKIFAFTAHEFFPLRRTIFCVYGAQKSCVYGAQNNYGLEYAHLAHEFVRAYAQILCARCVAFTAHKFVRQMRK